MFFGLDPVQTILTVGYLGIFSILFAESGLLIGFILPGDSLLFTAGFLASQGYLNIWVLTIGGFIAAVAGDSVGYAFGRRVGPALFRRKDSRFFKQEYVDQARQYFEKYGAKTILLARFIPFVRTFAPIVAGVGEMHYGTFLTYNLIGGFIWAVLIPLAGYFLGNIIPNVDQYLMPIIALILVLSVIPTFWEWIHIWKQREKRG